MATPVAIVAVHAPVPAIADSSAAMKETVYKIIELTGTSETSIEEAVNGALKRASKTLNNLRWFEVTDMRGEIDKGKVKRWQVTVKIGFHVD